jgi:hypothetical protein
MHSISLRIWLVCSVGIVLLVCSSCRDGTVDDVPGDAAVATTLPEPEDVYDVLSALQRPDLVTYVRYTTLTPPWPTRSVAWIDFDNDRSRSWDITTTDAWDNPFVCTSILDNGDYHACLPSPFLLPVADAQSVSPPMKKESEVSLFTGLFGIETRLGLLGGPVIEEEKLDDMEIRTFRWRASSPERGADYDAWNPCDEGVAPQFYYEYSVDGEGTPMSEMVGAVCGAEERALFGILYHEVRFVDPANLSPDFFDPLIIREQLVADRFSPLVQRFGGMHWLGFEPGPYILADIEDCWNKEWCLNLKYESADSGDTPYPMLELMVSAAPGGCGDWDPLESEIPGGALLPESPGSEDTPRYSVVWCKDDLRIELTPRWYGRISRDEFISIARNLKVFDGPVSADKPPLLTQEDVRQLVADSLDVVCPHEWATIRKHRDSAAFTYDEESREWRGTFGPFGEFAVPDTRPVAIPVAARDRIERQGGTYPPGYAECAKDAPTPEE